MKRVWVQAGEVTGSPASTWWESHGLSRNERSGRWTYYYRQDLRGYEEPASAFVGTDTTHFATTADLVAFLRAHGFSDDDMLGWTQQGDLPAMAELARCILGQSG